MTEAWINERIAIKLNGLPCQGVERGTVMNVPAGGDNDGSKGQTQIVSQKS